MRAVELVFAVVWAAFWLYWLVAAFSMKRGRVPWSRELGIRAVIVIVVVLLVRVGTFRGHSLSTDPWRAGVGLVGLLLRLLLLPRRHGPLLLDPLRAQVSALPSPRGYAARYEALAVARGWHVILVNRS
jgi:hypothetical protein